jgi:hypothetical protein
MAVYKFKVIFEDQDDVCRVIEIKPGQTFQDLHKAIQDSIKFDASADAEFYTSDDYWRKETKISFDEFKSTKISKYIDDPHQKFIYEFDPKAKWVLTVELMKILTEEESGASYPRCIKSIGKAPAQYHNINAVLEKEELGEAGEDDVIDDSLFYRDADEMLVDDDAVAGRSIVGDEEEVEGEQEEESEFEESDFEQESDFEDEY